MANDKISFGIDWRAEAEYGGYYQGRGGYGIYTKHGPRRDHPEGGPQVNHMHTVSWRLISNLGGGRAIEFVQNHLPYVADPRRSFKRIPPC